jgi:hypothetical protein
MWRAAGAQPQTPDHKGTTCGPERTVSEEVSISVWALQRNALTLRESRGVVAGFVDRLRVQEDHCTYGNGCRRTALSNSLCPFCCALP